ncbi:polyphosphate polymerase domain-containing protein [Carboxylicivirga sp. M1479]|uniref:polyphosphate polymerase domain-containing protein n=1 Tax=Carboxylicivirga sp. M1479 TaxID=2594476 RepID=UPI00117878E0|nr:polyphosphate polymerase domain-containing protein [Carboxylicivirga sp. M1479]TRX71100.1 polyphosphate polymerase domain-containing protein [Carboxylicivirga sp. M1479]
MQLPFNQSIQLKDIEGVKLMNRVDTKYWFHNSKLHEILEDASQYYYILEIENKQVLSYSTTYFDTNEDSMYRAHHNGHLNRYKIRQRTYIDSDISFIEIKHKTNKGRTIKNRISTTGKQLTFNEKEQHFLNDNCPFVIQDLQPAIRNSFQRITLVGKNFDERCTIDINLEFEWECSNTALADLAIVEIKTDGPPVNSKLSQILKNRNIKKSGFSKYCIGRTLSDKHLKHNAFKPNIRRLRKALNIYN